MGTALRWLLFVPYGAWLLFFVLLPLGLVVVTSFRDIDGAWTLANYERFLTPTYLAMAGTSVWYAFLITVITLAIAYPAAYLLTRTRQKAFWLMFLILPSWVNLLLKTYAFLGLLALHGPVNALFLAAGLPERPLLFTDFSFLLVSIYIFIPFMVLPIFNAIEEIPPGLIEAARDLGAGRWDVFRRVIWPLSLDGVRAGVQAVFIPALSLFMITRLIAGNRVITLGTAIEEHFLVTQDWGMGATIAVMLVVMMAAVMAVVGRKGERT
ncbi:MAG: ABC transporter permease [Hydrogenibacillus schlegelii]|nr:ABC transporter permease [Hydrogenibacillus schlegelii]